MKRILQSVALVLIVLTSACALPYPNQSPPILGQGMPGPGVSMPQATSPAGLVPQDATPVLSENKVFLPGIISAEMAQASGAAGPAPESYPPPAATQPLAPSATTPPEPTATPSPEPTATLTAQPENVTINRIAPYQPHTGEQLSYKDWQKWPVLPVVSQRAREIYQRGLAQGNDPTRFSKIGDCQVIRQYFLGYFDKGNDDWRFGDSLPKYKDVLAQFHGSYFRLSMAVRTGFNVASVLSAINSDPTVCKAGETPLQCEDRDWNPSIAIISMETWTANRPTAAYEGYLRKIVDFLISKNVLPILATKADNLEGDNSINQMVARVAYEYDIPLWNFWAASYPLPDHGLTEDGFHLTNGPSQLYGDSLKIAWNMRNLTALQVLDKVWRAVR
jgi:hypothetical protein